MRNIPTNLVAGGQAWIAFARSCFGICFASSLRSRPWIQCTRHYCSSARECHRSPRIPSRRETFLEMYSTSVCTLRIVRRVLCSKLMNAAIRLQSWIDASLSHSTQEAPEMPTTKSLKASCRRNMGLELQTCSTSIRKQHAHPKCVL